MLVVVVLEHAPKPGVPPRHVIQLSRLIRAPEDTPVLGKLELDVPLNNVFAVVAAKDIDDEARLGHDPQIWRAVGVVAEEGLHLRVDHLLYGAAVGLGRAEHLGDLGDRR